MGILKFFNPALFVVLIVCFLLPFVRVSCGNEVLIEASGMDIVTGTDYSKDRDKDSKDSGSDNYRYLVIIAFGFTVLGLLLSIFPLIKEMKNAHKIFFISLAAITVLCFILLIVYVYMTDRSLKDTKNILNFELLYGFFVLEAFYLIIAVVNILQLIFPDKNPSVQKQAVYYPPNPVNQNRKCGNCGTDNISGAAYCKNCGNKL
jgi:hypothetical protein